MTITPKHSTLVLTENTPPCAYQGDAFWGDLIESFAGGQRYGERRLDDTSGTRHDFCPRLCPTPGATATVPPAPSNTVMVATRTRTPVPPTSTRTQTPVP